MVVQGIEAQPALHDLEPAGQALVLENGGVALDSVRGCARHSRPGGGGDVRGHVHALRQGVVALRSRYGHRCKRSSLLQANAGRPKGQRRWQCRFKTPAIGFQRGFFHAAAFIEPRRAESRIRARLDDYRKRLEPVDAQGFPFHTRVGAVGARIGQQAAWIVALLRRGTPHGPHIARSRKEVQAHHVLARAAGYRELVLAPFLVFFEAHPTVAALDRVVDAQVEVVVGFFALGLGHAKQERVLAAGEDLFGKPEIVPLHEVAHGLVLVVHRHAGIRRDPVGHIIDDELEGFVEAVSGGQFPPGIVPYAEVGGEAHLGCF